MKAVKLVCVTEDNNNKYYNMTDGGDGLIYVVRGRVGVTAINEGPYPISKWDSLLRSKLKKYQDVTHLFTVGASGSKVKFSDISDRFISNLISKLETYTKKKVETNYNVSAESVTKAQIEEAQSMINYLMNVKSNRELNKQLLELFTVIPRKMKKVQDHLFVEADDLNMQSLEDIIAKEQELLDTMSQQVGQAELVNENVSEKATLLDAMGLEIFNCRPDQEQMIKNKLGSISDKFVRAFRVENKKTLKQFEAFVEKRDNKKTDLFWHGSRNENILPILQTGLLIRPTNAVLTGAMFGHGTYFASKAIKSFGYTSGRGSIWAKGQAPEAFMGLFKVHTGNQMIIEKWNNSHTKLNEKSINETGYDSVYAKAGYDLKNAEYIVYNSAQTTINYIVELKG